MAASMSAPPTLLLRVAADDPPIPPSIITSGTASICYGNGDDDEENVLMRSFVVAYCEDHFEMRRYKEVLTTIHPTLSLLRRSYSFRNSSRSLILQQDTDAEIQEDEKNPKESQSLDPSNPEAANVPLGVDVSLPVLKVSSTLNALDASMMEDLPHPHDAAGYMVGEKSLFSSLLQTAVENEDCENFTPRYPLLHGKNLATFSPEELNYRWRCELCGIEGLRSREYWSHCLEEEHRRRALAVASSTGAVSPTLHMEETEDAAATNRSAGSWMESSGQPMEADTSYSSYGTGEPLLAATEDDDDSTGESAAEQWRMIDPLNELETIGNNPHNECIEDSAIEWNPPPINDQSLWGTSIRSILEETPTRRARRYSADVWGSVLGTMEQGDVSEKKMHTRRRSCPDVLSPMAPSNHNNESIAFSMGSPSFNLGIVSGELESESSMQRTANGQDDTDSVGPLALLSKLAFF